MRRIGPRALILDFNGTLSDDEHLLDRLFREVLRDEAGVELTSEEYFAKLSGLSDPEIAERALAGAGRPADGELRDRVLRAKVDAYRREVTTECPIAADAADFARAAAERVPVAIASGAYREEIELVLELAGIADAIAALVCIDDVERGKPDPEGYLQALAALNGLPSADGAIDAAEVLAIEDSPAGVEAAHSAGMRCAAVPGSATAEREADFVIERLDRAAAERLWD